CGTIDVDGERKKLYAFVLVLGFSRMLFARFTTSMKQPVLLACLREAFERLGVPKELLVDNMKTAVDRHALGEEVRFNAAFLDFCEHYGCLDRKSTRLNSSHVKISYAVFCLKKKKKLIKRYMIVIN